MRSVDTGVDDGDRDLGVARKTRDFPGKPSRPDGAHPTGARRFVQERHHLARSSHEVQLLAEPRRQRLQPVERQRAGPTVAQLAKDVANLAAISHESVELRLLDRRLQDDLQLGRLSCEHGVTRGKLQPLVQLVIDSIEITIALAHCRKLGRPGRRLRRRRGWRGATRLRCRRLGPRRWLVPIGARSQQPQRRKASQRPKPHRRVTLHGFRSLGSFVSPRDRATRPGTEHYAVHVP